VIRTSDGGYAVLCKITGGSSGISFFKTDTDGNQRANKSLIQHLTSVLELFSVAQTEDGGYALVGHRSRTYAPILDTTMGTCVWLEKIDAGVNDWQWTKDYDGPGNECAYAVIKTSDGGLALAGETDSYGAGGYDTWLIKTDFNATAQWNMTYGGIGAEHGYALAQATDGGYIIAGTTNSSGAGGDDVYMVKTDANGALVWSRAFGGNGTETAKSVVQATDGGFVVAGSTDSFGAGNVDGWLIKTDANGNMVWNHTYGGAGADAFRVVVLANNGGGYAMTGYSTGGLWLVQTNEYGTEQSSRTYGGGGGNSLVQASDGGYLIAGYTSSNSYVWLLKTDGVSVVPEPFSLVAISLLLAAVTPIVIHKKRRRRTPF
jgi:hypothetical protein